MSQEAEFDLSGVQRPVESTLSLLSQLENKLRQLDRASARNLVAELEKLGKGGLHMAESIRTAGDAVEREMKRIDNMKGGRGRGYEDELVRRRASLKSAQDTELKLIESHFLNVVKLEDEFSRKSLAAKQKARDESLKLDMEDRRVNILNRFNQRQEVSRVVSSAFTPMSEVNRRQRARVAADWESDTRNVLGPMLALKKQHDDEIQQEKLHGKKIIEVKKGIQEAQAIALNEAVNRELGIRKQNQEADVATARAKFRYQTTGKVDFDLSKPEPKFVSPVKPSDVKHVTDLSQAFRRLTLDGNDVHSMARGLASGFNLLWLTWGNLVPLMAGSALSFGTVKSSKLGSEFEQSMFEITSLAGMAQGEAAKLSKTILDLAGSSMYSANEAAKAAKILSLAGLKGTEVAAALRPTLQFATAGGTSLEESAQVLTSVGEAYKFTAGQYSVVADIITKASSDSLASVKDMSEAFKTASVLAQTYGVSLTDTSIALEMLAQIGIKGSAAGTATRNTYTELAKGEGKVGDILKKLKVNLLDSTGAAKPLLDIMKEFTEATINLTGKEQVRIASVVSNERGHKLLAAATAKLQEVMKSSQKTLLDEAEAHAKAGRAAEANELRVKAVNNAYLELKDTYEQQFKSAAGITFFADLDRQMTSLGTYDGVIASLQRSLLEAFEGARPYLIDFGLSLREVFNSKSFREDVTSIVTSVANFGRGLLDVTKYLYEHKTAVAGVLALYLGFGPLKAVAGILGGVSTGLIGITAAAASASIGLLPLSTAFAGVTAGVASAGSTLSLYGSSVAAVALGNASAVNPTMLFTSAVWGLRAGLLGMAAAAAFTASVGIASLFSSGEREAINKKTAAAKDNIDMLKRQRDMQGDVISDEIARLKEAADNRNNIAVNDRDSTRKLNAATDTRIDKLYDEKVALANLNRESELLSYRKLENYSPLGEYDITSKYDAEVKSINDLRKAEKAKNSENIAYLLKLKVAEQEYALVQSKTAREKLSGTKLGPETGKDKQAAEKLEKWAKDNLASITSGEQQKLAKLNESSTRQREILDAMHTAKLVSEREYVRQSTLNTYDLEQERLKLIVSSEAAIEAELERVVKRDIGTLGQRVSAAKGDNQKITAAYTEFYDQMQSLGEKAAADRERLAKDKAKALEDVEHRLQLNALKSTEVIVKAEEDIRKARQTRDIENQKEAKLLQVAEAYAHITESSTATAIAEKAAAEASVNASAKLEETLRNLDLIVQQTEDAFLGAEDAVFSVLDAGGIVSKAMLDNLTAQEKALARIVNLKRSVAEEGAVEVEQSAAKAYEKVMRDDSARLQRSLADSVSTALFDGGVAGKKSLRDLLVAELKKPFNLVINALITPIVGALLGSMPGTAAASDGKASVSGLYKSVTNGVSGSVTEGFGKLFSNGFGEKLGFATPNGTYTTGSGAGYSLTESGNTWAGYTGTAGNAMAGYGLYTGLSGGYKTNSALDAIGKVASLFGPLYGAIGGLVNRAFGKRVSGQGIEGTFGGTAGFTGNTYTDYKGGWFRSNSRDLQTLDSSMSAGLSEGFNNLKLFNANLGKTLNLSADSLNNYTKRIEFSTASMTKEQIAQRLSEEFSVMNDELAQLILGTYQYNKAGEKSSDALVRLTNSLNDANATFELLGYSLYDSSLAGAAMASDLADKFGSLSELVSVSKSYYDNYYTSEEKARLGTSLLTDKFKRLGYTLPTATAGFRSIIESLDLTTKSGQETYAGLLKLNGEFKDNAAAIDDLAKVNSDKLLKSLIGTGGVVPTMSNFASVVALFNTAATPAVDSAKYFVGAVSTVSTSLSSGGGTVLYFGDRVADLTGKLDPAQLAATKLKDEIFKLQDKSDLARIGIENLQKALATVDTTVFSQTLSTVFGEVAKKLQDTLSSIADQRVAVRQAAVDIVGPKTYNYEQLKQSISNQKVNVPGAGLLAAAQTRLSDALSRRSAADANVLSTKSIADIKSQASVSAYNNAIAKQADVYTKRDAAYRIANAAGIKLSTAESNPVSDSFGNTAGQQRGSGLFQTYDWFTYPSAFKYNDAAGTPSYSANSYETQATAWQNFLNNKDTRTTLASAILSANDATKASWTASAEQTTANSDYMAALTEQKSAVTALSVAQEAAKQEALNYAAAVQKYSVNAAAATDRLSRLREETVKYYNQQKELADLMGKSAVALRKTVEDYRYSLLTDDQKYAKLVSEYSTAYSLASSTTGETLVSYADKMNSILPNLIELAGTVGKQNEIATLIARAESVATKLETTAPKNYQEESLTLLAGIDGALEVLGSGTDLIVNAVNAGKDRTADGLYAVIAAIRGQSIPAFATGGMHSGGWRLVGEHGPELEATGPARIYNAAETARMMQGGVSPSDNSELLIELQALRAEVAALRSENLQVGVALATNTSKTARIMDRWDVNGAPVQNAEGTTLKTKAV